MFPKRIKTFKNLLKMLIFISVGLLGWLKV